MKKIIISLLALLLLFTTLWAKPIPYPADSEAYNAVKQSRIGSAVEEDYRSPSGIMQSIKYQKIVRNGLLVPVDSTFTLALSGNDDSSTDAIPLPFVFDFYGSPQTEFYINNNGNISFSDPYSSYSSTGFPIAEFPIFAAFWADVDTRPAGSGKVFYKVEPHRVIVTWDQVGYYSNHIDKTNSFQIIFTDATDSLIGIGKNLAFSYADMQWTTGDASGGNNGFGGIAATVGLNQGDGLHYALIGRFDHAGTDYNASTELSSGISYLDNQLFIFNAQSMNIPPFFTGLPQGSIDLTVGQSVSYQLHINSAIRENMVSATIAHDFSSGFSYSVIPGNPCQIDITLEGRLDNRGQHTVTIDATDGGNPPLSSIATLRLNIQGELDDFLLTANQLEGSINILDVNTLQVYGPFLQGQLGGAGLYDVAVSSDASFALISNFDHHGVYQLDLTDLLNPVRTAIYYLGFAAEDISLSKNDRFALVADGGNATSIAVLDLQSRTTVQILNIAPHYAQGVEIGPDGKVLINDVTNGQIHQYLLNLQSGILSYSGVSFPMPNCINTAIHPSGKYALASSLSTNAQVLHLHSDNSISSLQSMDLNRAQSAIYSREGDLAIIAEFGLESDLLSVYEISDTGTLILRNSYPLPRNSGAGFYGVDTVALSTDNSKAFVGSFYSDDFSPLCYVNLVNHSVQELDVPGPAGIGIGKQGIQAFFAVDSSPGEDFTEVLFRDLSYGNPDARLWNFGDGQNSTALNPSHIYTEPGFYTATLTIFKANASDTFSVEIDARFETNMHLNLSGSPYFIHGNLVILEQSSLIIDAGVQVIFGPEAGLTVYGSLQADGVIFSADAGQSFDGITIDSRSQTLLLDNCQILNAVLALKTVNSSFTIHNLQISKNLPFAAEAGLQLQGASNMVLDNIGIDGYNPGIVLQNEQRVSSNPLLSNIRIRNSSSTSRAAGKGIEVLGAVTLQINNAQIDDFDTGINWESTANPAELATPLLSNIRIRNSSSTSRAAAKGIKLIGAGTMQITDVEIDNCNTGIEWDALNQPYLASTPLLSNIRIRNSSSTSRQDYKGIYLKNFTAVECSLVVINALPQSGRPSNTMGSGISLENSNASIAKATIWGIEHGLHLLDSASAELQRSVIWTAIAGEELAEPIFIESGQASVQQSNISYAAGIYAGTQNLNLDPKFVNPQAGNFYLKLRSPLRNTGIGALPFDFESLATGFQRTFTPGWNMCGIPIVPPEQQNTPSAIFGNPLAPFYVSPYYTSILQLNEHSMPDNLGHLVFQNSQSYTVPNAVYPAVGYWVRNPNPYPIDVNVYGIMDDEDYLLELLGVNLASQGHFMLANPYDRPLSLHSGITLEGQFNYWIQLYDASTNRMQLLNLNDPTAVIPPGAAFIIKANALSDKVRMSYPAATRERSINVQMPLSCNSQPQKPDWELYLRAQADDNVAVAVMGIAKAAADGYDPMDIAELPFYPNPLPITLYIQNTDAENLGAKHIRDIKSNTGNLWQWPLQLDISHLLVDGQYSGSVVLDLIPGHKIPSHYTFRITDLSTGQCAELSSNSFRMDLDISAEDDASGLYDLLLEARLQTPEIAEPEMALALSNYPNPFNPSTTFAYNVPEAGIVEFELFNIKGQRVRVLLSEYQDSGFQSVVWDGKDERGQSCASGFYFCRVATAAGTMTRKVLMLK